MQVGGYHNLTTNCIFENRSSLRLIGQIQVSLNVIFGILCSRFETTAVYNNGVDDLKLDQRHDF